MATAATGSNWPARVRCGRRREVAAVTKQTTGTTSAAVQERAPRSWLGPDQRRRALERMGAQRYDILVVGGGVTGAGIALDAATRGLLVAMVEMRDYASGTSSRSGKLIHGGLRYLEQMNFSLVREALTERGLMLTTLCPHLVRPVRFIYPLVHRIWERGYLGAGLALYDTIGGAGAVPRHRHLTKRKARQLAPALRAEGLVGALTFYDAAVDDARHTLTLARTAAAYGADIASARRPRQVPGPCLQGCAYPGPPRPDPLRRRDPGPRRRQCRVHPAVGPTLVDRHHRYQVGSRP
jgi:hypothetical protein